MGCYDKIPYNGRLKPQKFIFSQFSKLEVQIRVPAWLDSGESFLPGGKEAIFLLSLHRAEREGISTEGRGRLRKRERGEGRG